MDHETTPDRRTRLADRLLVLCALDSSSGREEALLPGLVPLLTSLGARVHLQEVAPGRSNVLALWGRPRVLFSTHLDTVPPFVAPMLAGAWLHGRGACDAKGQIVAQLGAVAELLDAGVRDVAWLGVVGEETDSLGARAALDLAPRLRACEAVVCGEPTDGKLATGQRGIQHHLLRCRGRAAHSSRPEDGHSALWPLMAWLERLRQRPAAEDPELGSDSWNLGRLEGGQAPNVVPDFAEAHLFARTVPQSRLAADIQVLMPPEGEAELLLSEPHDRYPRLEGFTHAPVPFGSDAPCLRNLARKGTVVLAGPGSIRWAHGPDERIGLDELDAGVDLNLRLAKHLLRMGRDAIEEQPAKRGPVRQPGASA